MRLRQDFGRAWIGAILACVFLPAVAGGDELRAADDLAALASAARERRVPIMIAFTQASCTYCERAKRDYLAPMHASPEVRETVIIREVELDSGPELRDFDGRTVTRREFARRYEVKRVPTVIVVDDRGKPLSAAIVGLLADDFYRLYLEQAIEEGVYKLRSAPVGSR